jgi:glucose/arabinose dehydrogenase
MLGIATKKLVNGSTYVFIYYTEAKSKDGDEPVGNHVYRYQLINNKLVNPKLLLELPATPRPIHNGGKIIVGPDNNVYLSIGDKKTYRPQTDEILNGTSGILRITQEGDPVTNNGILGSKPPLNLYYAYGIRNSFGMDFDPLTGNLWDTENGPEYGDEVNLVEPGFNSGWEKVHGIWIEHTEDSVIEVPDTGPRDLLDFDGKAEYSSPEFTFLREPGVTAIKFLNSDKLGEKYENDIFVGGFHNGIIYHFDLNEDRNELLLEDELEDKVADEPDELGDITFGQDFGGITDIQVGPDGDLYVLSLYQGGNDCPADQREANEDCISYSSDLQGTIFRISVDTNRGQ